MQTPGALMVSEKFYGGLSPDLRAALQDAATETMPYQRTLFRDADRATLERLKTKGVVAETADPTPFAESAKAAWKVFEDKVGGRAKIEAVLNTR